MPDRTPLLLLPGLLCDARLWRDQVAGFADVADAQVADHTRDDAIADMACRTTTTPRPKEEPHVAR